MTFGQVTIVDRAAQWTAADIQISAKNIVNPHAFVGGITNDDPAHIIRLGRFWNGSGGDQGNWSAPTGYRTLVHEFSHYALGIYDEYFGFEPVGSELGEPLDGNCTAATNWQGVTPDASASIMDNQYKATELADTGRWSNECTHTAQAQLNHNEADWQTNHAPLQRPHWTAALAPGLARHPRRAWPARPWPCHHPRRTTLPFVLAPSGGPCTSGIHGLGVR